MFWTKVEWKAKKMIKMLRRKGIFARRLFEEELSKSLGVLMGLIKTQSK